MFFLNYTVDVEIIYFDDNDDVPAVLLPLPLPLSLLLLLIEVLNLEAESCAALATSLEFCSKVLAALTF